MDMMLKCYICETEVVNLDAHFFEFHNLENDFDINESPKENTQHQQCHFCYSKSCKGRCGFKSTLDKIQDDPPAQKTKSFRDTMKKGKQKNIRQCERPEQIRYLKSSYDLNKYCTPEDTIKLSKLSGLSKQFIQKWFKLQRYKDKVVEKSEISNNEGQKEYKCDSCEKSFSMRKPLAIHSKVHGSNSEKNCDACGKSFTSKQSLDSHNKMVHKDIKQCKICKESFSTLQSLNKHIKYIHKGNKNQEVLCDKTILDETNLRKCASGIGDGPKRITFIYKGKIKKKIICRN